MSLYRIFAIIKKDLAWIRGNKKLLGYVLWPVIFLFAIIIFSDQLIAVKEITDSASQMELNALKMTDTMIKFFFFLMVLLSIGVYWTSDLILREKTKGTFLALLTTPLKYYEFVLGKLFLSFFVLFVSSLSAILTDSLIHGPDGLTVNFFVILNLALFSGILCLMGLICGIFCETALEQQKLVGLLMMLIMISGMMGFFMDIPGAAAAMPTVVQKMADFSPSLHFFQTFQVTEPGKPLIHTVFNALFFTGFFLFSYFYVKFYFSNSREKRFSLKLFAGLGSVLGLYLLSGLIYSHLFSKDYENMALFELKMKVKQEKSLIPKPGTIPLEDFFRNNEISGIIYLTEVKTYNIMRL